MFKKDEVYRSCDAFGSKGQGSLAEGDKVYRCEGTFCRAVRASYCWKARRCSAPMALFATRPKRPS